MRELSGASFIRALIPLIRALSSLPDSLPKAPLPNTVTLGLRISAFEFGGGTQIFIYLRTYKFGVLLVISSATCKACAFPSGFSSPQ